MNQTARIEEFFSMFRGGTETLKQYIIYQKKFTDGEEAIIEKKRNEIIERRIEAYRKDYEENKDNPERERQLQEISDKIEELSKESETAFLKPEVQLLYQKLVMLQGEGEHLIESEDFFEDDPEELNISSFMLIQNNFTLVLIYSFFENQLKRLCNILGENAPIHYYDLKGEVTVQCEKFLTKFCKVESFIFEQIHWQFLDTIRVLRNQIIHNNPDYFSVLTKKVLNSIDKEYIRRNLEEIIQTENFLRTEDDNDYCIRLSDTFLLKVINYIEIFFSDLENYVQKKR
ncbi:MULTISPECIES: hypothetical protein [Capnocytophaga]|jgi:hypothetical protein|uniref:hypothetical protein n=1 Tax=Capnocytophaga TaxID=1016 RepID=UPI00027C6530|nr:MULTISPECIES: hypothetical protein [Capnocytophaga]EJU31584.1 hypothetical protein HMPREF1154_1792 [Capnocytophaga sp. CM59]